MKVAGKAFALCLAALPITTATPAQQKPYSDDLDEKNIPCPRIQDRFDAK
jgi:hypothetical protein